MPVNIKVVGMKEFDAKIDRLRRNLPNQQPLFKAIAVELDRWENDLFKDEGRAIGWPRLKPIKWKGNWYRNARIHYPKQKAGTPAKYTKKGKRIARGKLQQGAMLLQDTRHGRGSLRAKATQRAASIGTDIDYMIAHHKGGGHLPKRQVVPEWENVRKRTVDAAWAFLRLRLRQSGL